VQGNFIGTDTTGTGRLANEEAGVEIEDASSNTVGGTNATTPGGSCGGACNVISGNGTAGVSLQSLQSGASDSVVQGNFIGTDVSGTHRLGNDLGVFIFDASNNTVGGTTPGARNLISGNQENGIFIRGLQSVATGNQLQGNFIGTQTDGTSPLGNSSHGILIGTSASNNTIGAPAGGSGNTVAFNAGAGVSVESGTGNAILSNFIFSNAELGIDLGSDGVTPNDKGDGDSGPNNLQNFPLLDTARSAAAEQRSRERWTVPRAPLSCCSSSRTLPAIHQAMRGCQSHRFNDGHDRSRWHGQLLGGLFERRCGGRIHHGNSDRCSGQYLGVLNLPTSDASPHPR